MNSEEEFLIQQALSHLKSGDANYAKCWLHFAKSVFPKSCPILFQSYRMSCDERNLAESAMCVSELVRKFPNEPVLVSELKSMAKALASEERSFLQDIFEQLTEDIKYDVMLAVTRNAQTVEEHCELMLLFLKRMPSARLLQHGGAVVDMLLAAEEKGKNAAPVNMFRKMLVCDALPLVLRVAQFDHKFKVVFTLMQKAVEFYVSCLFVSGGSGIAREVVPQAEENADEGWRPLLKVLEMVAVRYRWNYPEMFTTNFSETSLQLLLSLLKRRNKTLSSLATEKASRREEMSGYEEAYFCLVVTFFYYLHSFGRHVSPGLLASTTTSRAYNYILMEGVTFSQNSSSKAISPEFKRTDYGYLAISKTLQDVPSMLIPSFLTAVECHQLLHRHQHLKKEFSNLCSKVKIETWPVYREFYVCMRMLEREHREAVDLLGGLRTSLTDPLAKRKTALQIASCYHFMGDYEHCLKILFSIISDLSLSQEATVSDKPAPSVGKCPARFMYFMALDNHDIIQYCVSLLLKLYKGKDRVDDTYRDLMLGNMLVLIQLDIDSEYETLSGCIEAIKKTKNFAFSKFFNYVINVDILEEMSHLATCNGGAIALEILSTPTFQASKQRAVTRGVNKGARDDLKQAFVNQMSRCYDNIDDLFITFIKEERDLLLLPIKDSL